MAGLADMLMPMLMAGAPAAQQQGQGQMGQFYDPNALAQLETDKADYQRKAQLAQMLQTQGYVPNSGKFGMLAGLASMLGGTIMQHKNDDRLSDIIKRQFDADSQAAQAKRAQDLEDERRKWQEDVDKQRLGKQADLEFAPKSYASGLGAFDPRTGQVAIDPNISAQDIATKTAIANAQARAQASTAGAAGAAKMAQVRQLMAQPDSPTKTAQLSALLGDSGMQALAFGSMGGGGGVAGAGGTAVTGDDFLKNLNPGMAGQVKAIAEGRQAPPSGMAMRSPMGQALMQAVAQYDPTFDATNYAARAKTRNAFTSGKEGQSVNSMNTAIGHAGTLLDAADALNNFTGFPGATTVNSLVNSAESSAGDPRVKAFNTARDALAGELTKAFRGASGSEKDIQEVRNNLDSASSPEQFRASIGQAMRLLASKKESLATQYSQAFGSNSQPNFLDPHAQAALAKLQKGGIDVGALAEDEGLPAQAAGAGTGSGVGHPMTQPAGTPSLQDIMAELAKRGVNTGG